MEETRNNFGRKSITPKVKKRQPRVDLSAMVSISFLLIVFFMLTSYLSKPQVMDLGMPENRGCGGEGGCYFGTDNRTMTLLLDKNNRIICYAGMASFPIENPKLLDYGKNSIRKELLAESQQVIEQTGDPKKGLRVIIKPYKNSNYGNLVDILDEMAITGINTYAVVNDFTPEELQLVE